MFAMFRYQRIEWAADRIFDGAVPGARQTASRLLQKEIDLLRYGTSNLEHRVN